MRSMRLTLGITCFASSRRGSLGAASSMDVTIVSHEMGNELDAVIKKYVKQDELKAQVVR